MAGTVHEVFDASAVRAWAAAVVARLGEYRAHIDALNVFPVPDGDTGTNMFLTAESGAAAVEAIFGSDSDPSLDEVLDAFAQGALLGARGNSGVITSQILRGIAQGWGPVTDPTGDQPAVMAAAMTVAADLAYSSVGTPREGTILTVVRAASDAAKVAAAKGADLADVVVAATDNASDALARTPEMLDVLRDAGVVDSGGKGLVVILESLVEVLTGHRRLEPPSVTLPHPTPAVETHTVTYGGPAYEVMYLIDTETDEVIESLRVKLAALGDSLVVVGGQGLFSVHVHVDDIGAAIEAGVETGRIHRVKVTHLQLADGSLAGGQSGAPQEVIRSGRGVVAVSHGPGVAALLAENGVVSVHAKPGRRPSTAELLDGINRTGAAEVILLPSDSDTRITADAAAEQARNDGIRVVTIPTKSVVQSLAAIAVEDSNAAFEDDLVAMGRAAAATRYGAVTVAVRQAMTTAGVCQVGDVLGLVDGDIVVIEGSVEAAAIAVMRRMLDSGGELLTIVAGVDADAGLLDALVESAEDSHPEVEVDVVQGGQPLWPVIIGLE